MPALYPPQAHRDWDWFSIPKDPEKPALSGRRERLSEGHVQQTLLEIRAITATLRSFLLAPMCSRVRHFYTSAGRAERARIMRLVRVLNERLTRHFHALSLLVEELKGAGLPANEATRIRQHFVNALSAVMQLRFIKHYRTPLGLRAFSRFFILIMPVMLGPYYADLAYSTHLGFSIALSVATSLALQASQAGCLQSAPTCMHAPPAATPVGSAAALTCDSRCAAACGNWQPFSPHRLHRP